MLVRGSYGGLAISTGIAAFVWGNRGLDIGRWFASTAAGRVVATAVDQRDRRSLPRSAAAVF